MKWAGRVLDVILGLEKCSSQDHQLAEHIRNLKIIRPLGRDVALGANDVVSEMNALRSRLLNTPMNKS